MSSIGTGYDLSAGHFSPDGRVFQVEYAQKAVDASGTAVAAVCKDGVVFAVEKIITSKLYEPESNRRIFSVDTHVGCAVAGLLADAKHLVEIGHDEAANYRNENGQNIPIKYLSQRMALYAHAYTLYGALRPFGCSLLVGGLGHEKPEPQPYLFLVDPAGTSFGYHAVAIGKAKQNAKTELEKILPKLKDMTCLQLAKELAKIIYLVHDDIKDKHFLLEMSWVTRETNERHQFVPESVLSEAEAFAKAALAEQDADS